MGATMTKLEAVNSLLATISEMPITTLEETFNADAVLAVNILEETTREILLEGWYFNTDRMVILSPDSEGNIYLSPSVINLDIDTRYSNGVDVVQRGTRLYDKSSQTYKFKEAIKGVQLVHYLPFEEIPPSIQGYVLSLAKLKFHTYLQGDASITEMLTRELTRARTTAVAEDIRQADRNILDVSPNSRMGYNSFTSVLRR